MAGLVGWRADVARREARDVAAVLGVRAGDRGAGPRG